MTPNSKEDGIIFDSESCYRRSNFLGVFQISKCTGVVLLIHSTNKYIFSLLGEKKSKITQTTAMSMLSV